MPENNQLPEALTNPARRSVVKAAAWAVPVIAAATAVPLAAASGTDPVDEKGESVLNVTAYNVASGGADAYVEANGIRISPLDPANPKMIPAKTVFTITIEYTGNNKSVDFTNPTHGIDWNKAQNGAWSKIEITKTKMTFTGFSQFDAIEPVLGSIRWLMVPGHAPELNSVKITGNAVIPKGADFPNGGYLPILVVDPNKGTGTLTGPLANQWTTGNTN
ncbi:hypothetical protein [Glutamicibacter uratoxydans]|uniref:hypothetical protein n=1 Tax=Glutamicibacter uratoxydans TaxID=43667 RepID=UPI001143522E|nr:hypothetical protein [Glutamicibacter uratoxydans]